MSRTSVLVIALICLAGAAGLAMYFGSRESASTSPQPPSSVSGTSTAKSPLSDPGVTAPDPKPQSREVSKAANVVEPTQPGVAAATKPAINTYEPGQVQAVTSVGDVMDRGTEWIASKYKDQDAVARLGSVNELENLLAEEQKLSPDTKEGHLSPEAVALVKAELEWLQAHPKP